MTETTQVTQAELKPCPFCGGSKILVSQTIDQAAPNWYATCHRTTCAFTGYSSTREEAITAWNTRHRTQALADAAAEAEPVGYIIAEMLNRKSEFERNGIVMTAAPQGMSTLPLYAARPVQSELVEALEGLLKYEGHHVYCGHAPDYDQPCVCGFNEADAKARALVAKATGDGLS